MKDLEDEEMATEDSVYEVDNVSKGSELLIVEEKDTYLSADYVAKRKLSSNKLERSRADLSEQTECSIMDFSINEKTDGSLMDEEEYKTCISSLAQMERKLSNKKMKRENKIPSNEEGGHSTEPDHIIDPSCSVTIVNEHEENEEPQTKRKLSNKKTKRDIKTKEDIETDLIDTCTVTISSEVLLHEESEIATEPQTKRKLSNRKLEKLSHRKHHSDEDSKNINEMDKVDVSPKAQTHRKLSKNKLDSRSTGHKTRTTNEENRTDEQKIRICDIVQDIMEEPEHRRKLSKNKIDRTSHKIKINEDDSGKSIAMGKGNMASNQHTSNRGEIKNRRKSSAYKLERMSHINISEEEEVS